MIALDTSVVLRLLLGVPSAQADAARDALLDAQRTGDSVLVTDTVVGETYFALQHHYHMPVGKAVRMLRSLLVSGLVFPEPPSLLAAFSNARATDFLDRLIHARHQALGATTLTFDKKMARLPGAKRLLTL